MNYQEIKTERVVLMDKMRDLGLKINLVIDPKEKDMIQTEMNLIRDQLNALSKLEDDRANERSTSEKLLDLLDEIDGMMLQTSKLIKSLTEDHPHRASLEGELSGLKRAKAAVRKFHTGNVKEY